MNKLRLLSILVALLWTSIAARAEAEEFFKVENLSPESLLTYKDDILEWTRGVRIQYGEATLTADHVTLHELTGQVTAEGHVLLRRDKQLWTGDRIEYNFKTRQIKAAQFKTGAAPFYAAGVGLSLDQSNQVYTATDGYITTDDSAEPALRIRAKQLKFVPGQYIEARDAVLYQGSVPLMYFPYYKRNLNRHPNNWVLTPGYRSLYGPYLLTTYNWYVNDQFSAYVDMDYRSRREVRLGSVGQRRAEYLLHPRRKTGQ
jgi:lipopolysaccharide assembly outer membrane protein LptD (OstA)